MVLVIEDEEYIRRRALQMLEKSSETAGDISRVLYGGGGTAAKEVLQTLEKMKNEGLVRLEGIRHVRVWLPVKVFDIAGWIIALRSCA